MNIFRPFQNSRWMTYLLLTVDALLLVWLVTYVYMNIWPTSEPIRQANISIPKKSAIIAAQSAATPKAEPVVLRQVTMHIKTNDTLSEMFAAHHLNQQDLQQILQLDTAANYLGVIQPQQKITLTLDQHNRIHQLSAALDAGKTLIVERYDNQLRARVTAPHYSKTLEFATATIHRSLTHAAQRADVPRRMTAALTHIFDNRINFNKDIRPGDKFSVLYEAKYHDGVKVEEGPIVAAQFVNRGTTYEAIRFTDPDGNSGYFNPKGHSLKRLFLKAPLHYNRISSYFSYRRMDPIIHRIQAHLGVDFAAPRGTPVHSVSDGKIIFIGKKGGYGNAIIVKYGRHYRSLYGHLSRYAKHMHRGSKVTQGQVIAYVGSTGWATGPHLHYSFYVDGRAKNPLTVKLPTGSGVPKTYLALFKSKTKNLLAQLDLHQGPQLASVSDSQNLY
ncbi:MAG: peptidoglycan DD-metalloendopeptidase family protein [Coxiellaceae bacterium]|nr:peptidoglycan DD-metalloendopeptidase family protein [Coxiellaceae bacterium]